MIRNSVVSTLRKEDGISAGLGNLEESNQVGFSWGKPDFPGGSDVKECACNAGDLGSIPGLGRSPGQGNGNPLQYSCLENPMDKGAWRETVLVVAESQTQVSD